MKQVEDENERERDVLKSRVSQLEREVEQYRTDIMIWVDRCRRLENELVTARSQAVSRPTSDSVPLPRRPSSKHVAPMAAPPPAPADTTVGCGNCTLDTRCQCIDDAFNAMSGGDGSADVMQLDKRPSSPQLAPDGKRVKLEPREALEIDFTAMYSRPQPNICSPVAVSPSSAVADPCGFCSDGTPCICAEMAAEQEQTASAPPPPASTASRPIMQQLAQFTPPPADGDVSNMRPAPPLSCAGGPGTCAQCRSDPNSTLFCKSLAASRSQSASTPRGCCGGKTSGGSCCQSIPVPTSSRATRSRTANKAGVAIPVTLTCADAYTTLSRHPGYERASHEIGTWLPKLHANDTSKAMEGRPAMEIDAANVMAVLKDFDRRFGADR